MYLIWNFGISFLSLKQGHSIEYDYNSNYLNFSLYSSPHDNQPPLLRRFAHPHIIHNPSPFIFLLSPLCFYSLFFIFLQKTCLFLLGIFVRSSNSLTAERCLALKRDFESQIFQIKEKQHKKIRRPKLKLSFPQRC